MKLRMRNNLRVVFMLGSMNLKLPFKNYIYLEECYYVISRVKNIISFSCLEKMGYTFTLKNQCCSIYFKSKSISSTSLVNGLCLVNVSSYNL